MLKRRSFIAGVGILALVAVLISGAVLYAGTGQTSQTTAEQGPNVDVQDPSYGGSITIGQNAGDQALTNLAKITASEAEKAVLAQFPGSTILKTELDNENGVLVYSVELQSTGGIKDVKVDAGNGQILHVDSGGSFGESASNGEMPADGEADSQ